MKNSISEGSRQPQSPHCSAPHPPGFRYLQQPPALSNSSARKSESQPESAATTFIATKKRSLLGLATMSSDRVTLHLINNINVLATPFDLFGMDGLMILLIMLFLFAARKLPDLARGMGAAMSEFSKAKDDFRREVAADSERRDLPRLPRKPVATLFPQCYFNPPAL